jgi:hypothetical protein
LKSHENHVLTETNISILVHTNLNALPRSIPDKLVDLFASDIKNISGISKMVAVNPALQIIY